MAAEERIEMDVSDVDWRIGHAIGGGDLWEPPCAQDVRRWVMAMDYANPLHYDEAVARASRFGEIVVQGGVTSAILNALVAEDLPGPGTVFLQVNWSFRAPVRPGDTITGKAEVVEVRTDKPICKLKTTVTRGDGTVVLDGDAVCYTMPIRPRPPAAR